MAFSFIGIIDAWLELKLSRASELSLLLCVTINGHIPLYHAAL